MLDPPTRANLPADDADNADSKVKSICVNLRDLQREMNGDLEGQRDDG